MPRDRNNVKSPKDQTIVTIKKTINRKQTRPHVAHIPVSAAHRKQSQNKSINYISDGYNSRSKSRSPAARNSTDSGGEPCVNVNASST